LAVTYFFGATLYASIGSQYFSAPIAVETVGPLNMSACQLLPIWEEWSQPQAMKGNELFCSRVSVLVQRYSAVLLQNTLPAPDSTTDYLYPILYYLNF